MKKILFLFIGLIALNFISCSWSKIVETEKTDPKTTVDQTPPKPTVYYVKPPDWRVPEKRDSTIKIYSKVYTGYKIFLDPGHGGTDRHNRGPGKLVVEADLNLSVAKHLKNYLEMAGAVVYLSRDFDTLISLDDRGRLANESGADIFISVHHNAPGKGGDPFTNYTSTYYHATPKDYEHDPCDQDIAKYVQRDLAYVMGNSGGLGSFDGTYSDYWIYPGAGFAVLRNTKIPKILIEGSFFTSEYEEQRLALDEFNQIQAWGIFRGLGKYLRQGIVVLDFNGGNEIPVNGKQRIVLDIFDQEKGIDTTFCIAKIDKKDANYKFLFDDKNRSLIIEPKELLTEGEYEINVVVKNINNNHSFPFRKKIIVK